MEGFAERGFYTVNAVVMVMVRFERRGHVGRLGPVVAERRFRRCGEKGPGRGVPRRDGRGRRHGRQVLWEEGARRGGCGCVVGRRGREDVRRVVHARTGPVPDACHRGAVPIGEVVAGRGTAGRSRRSGRVNVRPDDALPARVELAE